MSELCARCRRSLRKAPRSQHARRHNAGYEVLRALSNGPGTLRQLAIGVYGRDTADNRNKVSRVLWVHRDVVENVAPRKWALRTHALEAAE